MTRQPQAPDVDTTRAHPARMYDYYLGGTTHYEADARAAEAVMAAMPVTRTAALANRDFMTRATRWLAAEMGVRQFLDIGSGLPTEPNLHRTAQQAAPDARVVYTDNDPLVLEHAKPLLHGEEGRTAYMRADVTEPDRVLDAPELGDTLDLGRPVALSVNALLHFVADEDRPYDIVRTLMSALPAGSFLVLTHATADFLDSSAQETADSVLETYARCGAPVRPRTRPAVAGFFEGLELVEPGLVPPQLWRPGRDAPTGAGSADVALYAGVARKL